MYYSVLEFVKYTDSVSLTSYEILINLKNGNVAKGFCKLQNFLMLTKQKSLSPPRNLALSAYGELLIVVPNKAQSAVLLLFENT